MLVDGVRWLGDTLLAWHEAKPKPSLLPFLKSAIRGGLESHHHTAERYIL